MNLEDVKARAESLLEPSESLLEDLSSLEGDILILGAGGKIGPSLALLTADAVRKAGLAKKVTAVSRFREEGVQEQLQAAGIETISADLLEEDQLQALPQAQNVLYLAGTKFGTTGHEPFTWAMNTYLPGRVAEKYPDSRIVVYSTGNVYPFMPVSSGGATEEQAPDPVGEYGQSCLGRERIFQYFSSRNQTPVLIYRLNYAIDMRYGVLLEIAKTVKQGRPLDLGNGYVNLIWQGDANEIALRSLKHCQTPASILNVTGPDCLSVEWLAGEFGKIFGKEPVFEGAPQPTALLSNASKCSRLFGPPRVDIREMIELTAAWLELGGEVWNKPTHFQERAGKF